MDHRSLREKYGSREKLVVPIRATRDRRLYIGKLLDELLLFLGLIKDGWMDGWIDFLKMESEIGLRCFMKKLNVDRSSSVCWYYKLNHGSLYYII